MSIASWSAAISRISQPSDLALAAKGAMTCSIDEPVQSMYARGMALLSWVLAGGAWRYVLIGCGLSRAATH